MRKHIQIALWAALVLTSCAKIIPPDGGDKDTTPPEVVQMVPSNKSTLFQGSEFYIEFNEYVQLVDIYNQLVISPPLEEKPEIRIKRKAVYVKLNEPLKPQTTYTFNFGDGVVDLNESNPAKDLIYVISTGSQLDTLALQGEVLDAFTATPVSGVKVMVYTAMDDSLPLKEKPYYFDKTDSDGQFNIANMRNGSYKLFALEELNNNYLYDDPGTERIAFLDYPVEPTVPDSASVRYKLRLSAEQPKIQYIQDYRIDSSGFAALKFYANASDIQFVLLNGSEKDLRFQYNAPIDTVYVWWDGELTSQNIAVEVRKREEVIDTLTLPIQKFKSGRLSLQSALPKKRAIDSTLTLRWNRPVNQIDTSKWSLLRDSLPMKFLVKPAPDAFSTALTASFAGGEKYQLTILPGGVISREGWKNDSVNYNFETYPDKYFGEVNLQLKAPNPEGQWIVRLLDSKGKIYRQLTVDSTAQVSFERLLPDQYILQLLDDRNMNGDWDSANYFEGIQPEMIYLFQQHLNVRSNWEMDLEWEIKNP